MPQAVYYSQFLNMIPVALFMIAIYGAIGFVVWKFYQALVRIGRELAEIKEALRAGRS